MFPLNKIVAGFKLTAFAERDGRGDLIAQGEEDVSGDFAIHSLEKQSPVEKVSWSSSDGFHNF